MSEYMEPVPSTFLGPLKGGGRCGTEGGQGQDQDHERMFRTGHRGRDLDLRGSDRRLEKTALIFIYFSQNAAKKV
jgi:hypothetical protein